MAKKTSLLVKKPLEVMRHSCEHVLTQAILQLYPKIKMAMGPATEDGFYFDFDSGKDKISQADFPKIEAAMKKIIKADLPMRREKMSLAKVKKLFVNNPYKQEWLKEIGEKREKAIVYWTGPSTGSGFIDLCSGPHLTSTGKIGPFKLLSVAGAYWRGSEKNKMLTRIYGTCFSTQKELDDYLKMLEEAKKRDHRKIGKELDLFSFHPEAPGDVFWHPKGLIIINEMIKFWREIHAQEGYLEVRTPEILTRQIWEQSGHTNFFLEKMYRVTTPDAKEWNMAIKPMNCDGGILIYKSHSHSYKEFPLRVGEIGVVHRYESSGELQGILRPREFTQDDAHIYCTPEQVKSELERVIDLCFKVYDAFDLKVDRLELSTRPEGSIGSDEVWEKAEAIMRQLLKEKKIPYQINEGEGAFYGPKFDFHLKDSIGRTWQCATIQLDFAQPENFNLEYVTKDGNKARTVMIHRVIYGSIERFLGILIEDCAGAFPVWLAPVQAVIVPVTDQHLRYGQEVLKQLRATGVRVRLDDRSETTSAKIRDAELQKIPYILVIGDKEIKKKKVNVRIRGEKVLGMMSLAEFLKKISVDIAKKRQI